jgi:glycosyltransferase involved in cell wall biosynthesis
VRACIDATALGSGRGGDETMLSGLIRGLSLAGRPTDRFTVLADGAFDGFPAEDHGTVQIERMSRRGGAAHFGAELPWYLSRRRREFDVVFTVTHAPVRSAVPTALMVLDLSFLHLPGAYPWSTRARLRALVGHQVRRATTVVTISEFSRRDLIESYRLSPHRVHVVPLTIRCSPPLCTEREEAAVAALAGYLDRPFLLYLGNLHPRKNVARTIRSFVEAQRVEPSLRGHRLIIAGGRWWGDGEEQEAERAQDGSVVLLGRVDDEMRQVLLERAQALVYLSLFEGFGLPPLEAMAAGTPVLAADAAAIPEVSGEGALLVDPVDDRAVVAAMRRIMTDGSLRAELVERGRRRVAHYDAAKTGTAALAALTAAAEFGDAG